MVSLWITIGIVEAINLIQYLCGIFSSWSDIDTRYSCYCLVQRLDVLTHSQKIAVESTVTITRSAISEEVKTTTTLIARAACKDHRHTACKVC